MLAEVSLLWGSGVRGDLRRCAWGFVVAAEAGFRPWFPHNVE